MLPPASPRRVHAGSAPVCVLASGEGTPWPLLLQAWSADQPYGSHLGTCSKAECGTHPPHRTQCWARVGFKSGPQRGPPGGPVIRTPRSPAAEDLGCVPEK